MALQHPFDANHPRCAYPIFGKHFDEQLDISGLPMSTVANACGIAVENVRAYRRGFQRPSPAIMKKLETTMAARLDVSEEREKVELVSIRDDLKRLLNRVETLLAA